MEHLTEERVMHRDLAARNVLVFSFDAADPSRTLVKICDYGLARDAGGSLITRCKSPFTRHMLHVMDAGGYYYGVSDALPTRWMPPESLQVASCVPSCRISHVYMFFYFL